MPSSSARPDVLTPASIYGTRDSILHAVCSILDPVREYHETTDIGPLQLRARASFAFGEDGKLRPAGEAYLLDQCRPCIQMSSTSICAMATFKKAAYTNLPAVLQRFIIPTGANRSSIPPNTESSPPPSVFISHSVDASYRHDPHSWIIGSRYTTDLGSLLLWHDAKNPDSLTEESFDELVAFNQRRNAKLIADLSEDIGLRQRLYEEFEVHDLEFCGSFYRPVLTRILLRIGTSRLPGIRRLTLFLGMSTA